MLYLRIIREIKKLLIGWQPTLCLNCDLFRVFVQDEPHIFQRSGKFKKNSIYFLRKFQ